ncbi:hypothetical protein GF402_01415 [Candidatus Fermentibacteria bacterium]|nr:hypothetical protein [Candidatus Fermentibacteria bacterium]
METLTEMLLERGLGGKVISNSTVRNVVDGSQGRRWGLLHRAFESGELIRLKRGLYVVNPSVSREGPSVYLIANMMVSGGYVSMESALDFHGWLQESPAVVSSCIPEERSRSFQNRFGEFVYRRLPWRLEDFYLGVGGESSGGDAFVIAGPERALGDTLYSRRLSWEGISGLCARLRIDMELLEGLDLELLGELTRGYRSPQVRELLDKLRKALGGES